MAEIVLFMLVVVLASFGLTFAILYGCVARNHPTLNADSRIPHLQVGAVGSGVALLCWGIVWWMDGLSAIAFPYWWVGVIPFTMVYAFEFVEDVNLSIRDVVGNWFIGCLLLCIPVVGPVCTIGAGIIFAIGARDEKRAMVCINAGVLP